jgi:hypothetical protein
MYMKHLFALVLGAVIAVPLSAQDFDKGLAAYVAGDYETALKEWRPLAEKGRAGAQYFLAQSYYYGNGVPKDSKEAFKWFGLASEQGHAEAQTSLGWTPQHPLKLKYLCLLQCKSGACAIIRKEVMYLCRQLTNDC